MTKPAIRSKVSGDQGGEAQVDRHRRLLDHGDE